MNKGNRIQWNSKQVRNCKILGEYGFSARTIGMTTGLSAGQAYYRLRKKGVKLRDYRNGLNNRGMILIRKYIIE